MNSHKFRCLALLLGLVTTMAQAAEEWPSTVQGEVGQVVTEKAQRQQNRVENAVDSRIDQTTDRAVDKVLNKTLDKIFGR